MKKYILFLVVACVLPFVTVLAIYASLRVKMHNKTWVNESELLPLFAFKKYKNSQERISNSKIQLAAKKLTLNCALPMNVYFDSCEKSYFSSVDQNKKIIDFFNANKNLDSIYLDSSFSNTSNVNLGIGAVKSVIIRGIQTDGVFYTIRGINVIDKLELYVKNQTASISNVVEKISNKQIEIHLQDTSFVTLSEVNDGFQYTIFVDNGSHISIGKFYKNVQILYEPNAILQIPATMIGNCKLKQNK